MSKKDKNESIDSDNNQNDNECNKRTIKILRQNMENSIGAGSSSVLGDSNVGNCYRSILIDDGVDYKDLQIQMHAGQGFRAKNCEGKADVDDRRTPMCHRAYCRESFSRRFQKANFDSDSYAIINLMLGLKRKSSHVTYRHLCLFSVLFAFALGLLLGIFIPFSYNYVTKDVDVLNSAQSDNASLLLLNQSVNFTDFTTTASLLSTTYERTFASFDSKNVDSIKIVRTKGAASQRKKSIKLNRPKKFSSVSFVDDLEKLEKTERQTFDRKKGEFSNMTDIEVLRDAENPTDEDNIMYGNVFWGPKIEKALPVGFGTHSNNEWTDYMQKTSAIKMETGCGRMQNRLVTFLDGRQACVRYRQNTDQIQGELFSFYLAQLLNLPNLVPSLVSLVNLTDSLWQNVATDIGSAQWNSNRPVVMTKYISNLESAHIPEQFKPTERHLNKHDVLRMIKRDTSGEQTTKRDGFLLKKIAESLTFNSTQSEPIDNGLEEVKNDSANVYFESIVEKVGGDMLDRLVELAQWSDLIIFDYLTANLDRIVNNLYNYQWNVNIMDAPAHNLAKKVDSNLLLFLDNESGLLHGYRLLHKYEIYHSLLLDNLCVFRKSTADAVQALQKSANVGDIMNEMFKRNNSAAVQDVLPPLPEKSVKILNERISRVASQIKKCQEQFSAR